MPQQRLFLLVAGYSHGDAISNEARILRDLFRRRGLESHVVCESCRILPELQHDALTLEAFTETVRPNDIAFLQLSIGSAVNDVFRKADCRKVLLYQNITPAEYFQCIHPGLSASLAWGRRQLIELAGCAEITLAASTFNARELEAAGHPPAALFPLLIDWSTLTTECDRALLSQWNDDKTNILFVGRCAPNKKIEDVLFAFHFFQKYVEPESRLIHVGSYAGTEKYHYWLKTLVRKNSMRNVELIGTLTQPELNAAYACANVFLCMSEHEGFCVPLLEAMQHRVPILAFDAGAVAETLGGAGILVRAKKFDQIAEMMGRIAHDKPFRQALLEGQDRRLETYKAFDMETRLLELLAPVLTTH